MWLLRPSGLTDRISSMAALAAEIHKTKKYSGGQEFEIKRLPDSF
jgi:hypothetical protein